MARVEVRKVRLISGDGNPIDWSLDQPISIGRSSSNDLPLRDSRVSRRHCVIERIDGIPHLRDAGSQKGTFLNGVRLNGQPARLKDGDRITIRPFELIYKDPERAEPDDSPRDPEVQSLRRQVQEAHERLAAAERERSAAAESLLQARREFEAERVALNDQITSLQRAEHDRLKLQGERENEFQQLSNQHEDIRARLAAMESQHASEVSRLQSSINHLRGELDSQHAESAQLQRQIGELDAARQAAELASQRHAQLISDLNRQMAVLEEAGQRVEAVQERLTEAEAAWAEIDHSIDLQPDADPSQVEAVATFRQHLSTQLISLNGQRDEAVTNLRTLIIALQAMLHRHGPLMDVTGVAAEAPRKRRRWLGLGAGK